jgi:glutathione peroxidase
MIAAFARRISAMMSQPVAPNCRLRLMRETLSGGRRAAFHAILRACEAAILRRMVDRRHLLLGAATAGLAHYRAQAASIRHITAYALTLKGLDGGELLLSSYAGRPILVGNTASLCGYTPQYTGLQALWKRYRDKGLVLPGCRPTTSAARSRAARLTSKRPPTTITMSPAHSPTKSRSTARTHPFYGWAAQKRPLEASHWNFHKYLISGDGGLRTNFTSAVDPNDPHQIAAIEQELAGE